MNAGRDGSRPGRGALWLGLALLAVFAGLAAYQMVMVGRLRFVSSAELLAELAEAELPEDEHAPGDWPQWRGRLRDGITSMPDLLRSWPERGPPRRWQKPGGEAYSSFAVAGGRAYTMVAGDDGDAVVCRDLATGKERWRHPYRDGAGFQYPGPRATPTVIGDRLWTVSPGGKLMCLRTTDGEAVWEVDLPAELRGRPPKWGYAFSPLVEGGLVYTTPGGRAGGALAAFDKDTGKLAWSGQDDPAGYSSPVAATIAGVRQVLYFTGRRLLGVTPDEGKALWQYDWETRFEVNAATPVVIPAKGRAGGWAYIFISSGYEKGCALVKVWKETGQFRARAVYESSELCCHFSSPVRYKEQVYGLDEKRDLTCLDLRTGRVRWRFARDDEAGDGSLRQRGFNKGALIRVDDVLVVLGEDGKLALVEATPEKYQEVVACRPFRDRCWALPVVAEGRLLLRDRRQVLCLDVRKR